jgi:prepilin peptidase CpaA
MTVLTFIVLFLAATAAVTDVRTRHIPNLLTFGSAIAALVFHVAAHGVSGLETAAGGWAVGAAFFMLPYALGGLGAGDVKLVAALGAWLGPAEALWLCAYTAMAGGAIALVAALAHGYLRQALSNIWLLLMHWRVMGVTPLGSITLATSRGPRVAYGVAVLFGAMGTIWFR